MAGGIAVIELRVIRHCHDARVRVDGERSIRIVVQAISDGVGRAVRVAGQRRNADSRSVGCILGDLVVRCVDVVDGPHVKLVDIGQVDRHRLHTEGTVGTGRSDGDAVTGRRFVIKLRAVGHPDHTGIGVDCEASACVVIQAIGDRVGGGVRIAGEGHDSNRGPVGRVFGNLIGGRVDVIASGEALIITRSSSWAASAEWRSSSVGQCSRINSCNHTIQFLGAYPEKRLS